jgi:hypothetical protein
MGSQDLDQFREAARLTKDIKKLGVTRSGCIEVALTALGGKITPEAVQDRIRIIDKERHNTATYLDKHGLTPVAYVSFDSPPVLEEVSEILDNPKYPFNLSGEAPPRDYVNGFLMEMVPHSSKKKGHAVAILHRDALQRDDRKMLKKDNCHIMVDLQRPELIVEIDDESLTDSISSLVEDGFYVTFYFLRKRRG